MYSAQPPGSLATWIRRSVLLQCLAVVFGYVVCARFASDYALMKSGVVVLWLPNAVVLSALLLTRTRQWWMFCLALVASELAADAGQFSPLQALGFALANLFEVLLSALLIRHFCGKHFAFANLREVVLFAAIAMGLAPALAAALGTWIYCNTSDQDIVFLEHWQIWWMGDGMGMVVLTPLLFGWLHVAKAGSRAPSPSRLEGAAFVALLVGLFKSLFFDVPEPHSMLIGSPLLLLPMFLWAAMRFGVRGVSVLGCAVSLLAIAFTARGLGVFSLLDEGLKTLVLQQYLASLLLTSLAVAAILNDLRSKYQRLRVFQRAIENMGEGMIITDAQQPDNPIIYCNPKFEEMTGYLSHEVLGKNCRFLNTPAREQAQLKDLREHLESGNTYTVTLRNFSKDGQSFWNQLTVSPVLDARGIRTHFIGIQRDVTDIRQAEQNLKSAHQELTLLNQELEQRVAQRTAELERLATTDPLTDAHNRRFLMARAEIEVALATRQSRLLSMVMFDIDHFKRINDSHGHIVGDQVLAALSQAVKIELRTGDTFARVGGEEFVLLLPQANESLAWQVAERMRLMIEALNIVVVPGLVLHITSSFGVATIAPSLATVDALYVASDTALYRAKAAGRNCVLSYQP